MDNIKETIQKIIELMGFKEAEVIIDEEHRRISLVIDNEIIKSQIIEVLRAFDHLINLMLYKQNQPNFVIDLNYYRKERERLILELARAAARKAMATKTEMELPPMNSYERRLVHMEIAAHPELKTESVGLGRERRVIIKPITNNL